MQATGSENLAKFGFMLVEIFLRTDKSDKHGGIQTDRRAHHNTPLTAPGQESEMFRVL